MQQPIMHFYQDEEGHWVAALACGHGRHMRHIPPWINRPWVLDKDSRAAWLGTLIDCRKCDAED